MIQIYPPTPKKIKSKIILPSSKSESNRILAIKAISGLNIHISNLAPSKDTVVMQQILRDVEIGKKEFNVGHAGTTIRFLTAYLSTGDGEYILTGSERMKQRPIGVLVDNLRKLGAQISYVENEGFPPLKITGKKLQGKKLLVDGSISSQFISALLMIAPNLESDLELSFTSTPVSIPYINMTIALMRMYGAEVDWVGAKILCKAKKYSLNESNKNYSIEGDWSSASYIYSIVALCNEAQISISPLKMNSLQGDSKVKEIFESLGIASKFENDELLLSKSNNIVKEFNYDFSDCPDLAQTVAACMVGLGIGGKLSGLKTLRVKETDRIAALKNELEKFNCNVEIIGDEAIVIKMLDMQRLKQIPEIKTYEDHRMALSFAPLAIKFGNIKIENENVVAKSYPSYWDDLKMLGFGVILCQCDL